MNKFYLPVGLSLCFALFFSVAVQSQTGCPPGKTPFAAAYNVENKICYVLVRNMWPGEIVNVVDEELKTIGSATTDSMGVASVVYPCDKTPFLATACSSRDSICCKAYIPAAIYLPMKLTNFSAEITKTNDVLLNWSSEMELSSYQYVVQSSNDGKVFRDIGNVKAAGNSDKLIKYNFTDVNFNGGVTYFRLKQLDIDGRFEYSKVVYVNNKKSVSLVKSVAPNPFTSEVQLIGITSAEVLQKNIRVFNSFGQIIQYRITGANAIAIDASVPRGIYYVRVKDQTFKLFKN